MAVEIKVPALGESVAEATIGRWFKKAGESVKIDEPLVELETDKVTIEVPAPASGVLQAVNVQSGQTVKVGAVLGAIESGESARPAADVAPVRSAPAVPEAKPAAAQPPAPPQPKPEAIEKPGQVLSPAVRKAVEERKVDFVPVEHDEQAREPRRARRGRGRGRG